MNGRRGGGKKGSSGRDPGGFIALPWSVLDCPAYAHLSHPARSLLIELARQYVRDNNGRLLASRAYLAARGWKSAGVIDRAKRELIKFGFVFETVRGHRPNKASWYAVTWYSLDMLPGYDPDAAENFRRGAYQEKNAALSKRTESRPIGLSERTERPAPVLSERPISAVSAAPPVLSERHHLEMPSACIELKAVPDVVPDPPNGARPATGVSPPAPSPKERRPAKQCPPDRPARIAAAKSLRGKGPPC